MKAEGPKAEKMGKFDKYEVEDALRTLVKACEHKKNPDLMAEVSKLAKGQKDALGDISEYTSSKKPKSLDDVRKMASEMDDME